MTVAKILLYVANSNTMATYNFRDYKEKEITSFSSKEPPSAQDLRTADIIVVDRTLNGADDFLKRLRPLVAGSDKTVICLGYETLLPQAMQGLPQRNVQPLTLRALRDDADALTNLITHMRTRL